MTKEQWKKVLKGALIAFLAAGATSVLEYATKIDFGAYTPAVQALAAVIINAIKVAAKI